MLADEVSVWGKEGGLSPALSEASPDLGPLPLALLTTLLTSLLVVAHRTRGRLSHLTPDEMWVWRAVQLSLPLLVLCFTSLRNITTLC